MEKDEYPTLRFKQVLAFNERYLPEKAFTFWSPMYGANIILFIKDEEGEDESDSE